MYFIRGKSPILLYNNFLLTLQVLLEHIFIFYNKVNPNHNTCIVRIEKDIFGKNVYIAAKKRIDF